MEFLLFLAFAGVAIFYVSHVLTKKRRARLMAKYGDSTLVDQIMRKMFWQGQTAEQLLDSLGRPADIDSKVMKSRSRQVWKYHASGKNRYRLRITLDDNHVVGWDQK